MKLFFIFVFSAISLSAGEYMRGDVWQKDVETEKRRLNHVDVLEYKAFWQMLKALQQKEKQQREHFVSAVKKARFDTSKSLKQAHEKRPTDVTTFFSLYVKAQR